MKGLGAYWIYSVATMSRFIRTCKQNKTIRSFKSIINSTRIIAKAHCQYYSEKFVLLPVSDSFLEVKLLTDKVEVPDLPKILMVKKQEQLM
jgi:hypothetical protein